MLVDGRVPLPGGHGVRVLEVAPGSDAGAAQTVLTRRAFVAMGLIVDDPGDDVRFVAIDRLWCVEVDRWFSQAPPPINAIPRPKRIWVMLAELALLAGQGVPDLPVQFSDAVKRLCPGFPTDAKEVPDAATYKERQAVRVRLGITQPPPLPADSLTCRGPVNAAEDYLVHLRDAHRMAPLLSCRSFVRAAKGWFAAAHSGESEEAAVKALTLFASMQGHETGASLVHELWRAQVNAWFRRATQAQAVDVVAPMDRPALLLEALATLAREAESPLEDGVLQRAAAGLGLGLPLSGKAPAQTIADLQRRLRVDPLLPWAVRPNVDDYFKHLSSLYGRSKTWTGSNFIAATAQWFDAHSNGTAQEVACATLACIGGNRTLDWRWVARELVDASRLWCLGQVAEGQHNPFAAMCQQHLRQLTYSDLVVHSLAWLCGVHPGRDLARHPVPKGMAEAVRSARAAGWLTTASQRVNRETTLQHANAPWSRLFAQRYQPPGKAKFSVTKEQWQQLEGDCARATGRNRLRGHYFLRVLHSQLQFAAPNNLHEGSREGFYDPVSSILGTAATQPDCGLSGYAEDLLDALKPLWLFGGDTPCQASYAALPDCFDPLDLSPLPALADLEVNLGRLIGGLHRTQRLALVVLDILTDPLHAAHGLYFKREHYKYVENVLRDTARHGHYSTRPVFKEVRMANRRLAHVLAQDNLQHQVKRHLVHCGAGVLPKHCTLRLA
ncbi:MAG: hypothetical protein KDI64_10280 [Candidatus Accumulibacter sp.]|nr:hypothetical protein [Accumulibacter sp.]